MSVGFGLKLRFVFSHDLGFAVNTLKFLEGKINRTWNLSW